MAHLEDTSLGSGFTMHLLSGGGGKACTWIVLY